MFKKIKENFKRTFCRHDWECTGNRVVGATLNWALLPARQLEFSYACKKCGATKIKGGQVLPPKAEKILYKEGFDETGWPLDKNGNRLPVAP